jgi:hypothetical protein
LGGPAKRLAPSHADHTTTANHATLRGQPQGTVRTATGWAVHVMACRDAARDLTGCKDEKVLSPTGLNEVNAHVE